MLFNDGITMTSYNKKYPSVMFYYSYITAALTILNNAMLMSTQYGTPVF